MFYRNLSTENNLKVFKSSLLTQFTVLCLFIYRILFYADFAHKVRLRLFNCLQFFEVLFNQLLKIAYFIENKIWAINACSYGVAMLKRGSDASATKQSKWA